MFWNIGLCLHHISELQGPAFGHCCVLSGHVASSIRVGRSCERWYLIKVGSSYTISLRELNTHPSLHVVVAKMLQFRVRGARQNFYSNPDLEDWI